MLDFLLQPFVLAERWIYLSFLTQKLRLQILYASFRLRKELIRNKYLRAYLLRKGYSVEEVSNFAHEESLK